MPPPRRVVIDPGVFVSAAITPQGVAAAAVRLVEEGALRLVLSPKVLAELDEVLHRDKFWDYGPAALVDEFINGLVAEGEMAGDPSEVEAVSRDPDDDYLIALARAADADALVSGDSDLLDLDLPDMRVMTPRQLLDAHRAS